LVRSIQELKLGLLFIFLALFGLVHHFVVTGGTWWSWADFWHHEPLIALCAGIGGALLIRRERKEKEELMLPHRLSRRKSSMTSGKL